MFPDLSSYTIYLKPGHTDMRKHSNSLSIIVEEEMNINLLTKSIFLFCSRNRKTIKCLYWDRNGFCLWQKKLEVHKYPWPDTGEEAEKLTLDELKMLLKGIDFFKAHKSVYYSEMN